MKILITGATGFVGRNIIYTLQGIQDYEFSITTRNYENANSLFSGLKNLHIIDLTRMDYKLQIKAFNPDTVIHLATVFPGAKRDEHTISKLIDANISFGINILDSLEGTNIKYFINTGTYVEYQFGTSISLNSSNLYGTTKTAFRSFIDFYQRIYGFKWINVIPYHIYGLGISGKVMNFIMDSFDSPQPIAMTLGEQKIDFIHIDDVCNFYKLLLEHLENINSNYKEYHVGSGIATSIRDVAGLMERILAKKANIIWGSLPYRENEVMLSKAPEFNGEISWKPVILIEDGLKQLLMK